MEKLKGELNAFLDVYAYASFPRLQELCAVACRQGKRVRGLLALECGASLPAAAAVEMLHAASLVVDDLMDGDMERRGLPTIHVSDGAAMAHLVAMTLFLQAQKIMYESDKDLIPHVIRCVSTMMEGQTCDVTQTAPRGAEMVAQLKTAGLFELACLAGYAGSVNEDVARDLGRSLGQAFQIADDIGDVDKDAPSKRITNVALAQGVERSVDALHKHLEHAHNRAQQLKMHESSVWKYICLCVKNMQQKN